MRNVRYKIDIIFNGECEIEKPLPRVVTFHRVCTALASCNTESIDEAKEFLFEVSRRIGDNCFRTALIDFAYMLKLTIDPMDIYRFTKEFGDNIKSIIHEGSMIFITMEDSGCEMKIELTHVI